MNKMYYYVHYSFFVEVLFNMTNRIFDKKNVILLKVNEDDLNTFLVDMDIDDEGIQIIFVNFQ